MIELNGEGSPVEPLMKIKHISGQTGSVSPKVKETKWADDPKPWIEYPLRNSKMHTSSEIHYLYTVGKSISKGNIVNLGVGKGISVAAFAYGIKTGNNQSHIHGVDLYNHIPECPKSYLEELYASLDLDKYITLHQGFTQDLASKFSGMEIQCLFIDADHHYESVKSDFDLYSKYVPVGGLVLFHDVNMNTVHKFVSELPSSWELVDHIWRIKTFRRSQ